MYHLLGRCNIFYQNLRIQGIDICAIIVYSLCNIRTSLRYLQIASESCRKAFISGSNFNKRGRSESKRERRNLGAPRNRDFSFCATRLAGLSLIRPPLSHQRNRFSCTSAVQTTLSHSRILTVAKQSSYPSQWLSSSSSAAPLRATPAGSLPWPPPSRSKSLQQHRIMGA
jgi:hypothetical protein